MSLLNEIFDCEKLEDAEDNWNQEEFHRFHIGYENVYWKILHNIELSYLCKVSRLESIGKWKLMTRL